MPRRRPRDSFPTKRVVLDASSYVRYEKCGGLDVLARATDCVELLVAGQVHKELRRRHSTEREATLKQIGITKRSVVIGESDEWAAFCRVRGSECSTRDLGEDESLAICLADGLHGEVPPFVTDDVHAAKRAHELGVATVNFLSSLAWFVDRECVDAARADELTLAAAQTDGWVAPNGYPGSIASWVKGLVAASRDLIERLRGAGRVSKKQK